MWSERKSVVLCRGLEERKQAAEKSGNMTGAAQLEKRIAKRRADPRFSTTLRHIGEPHRLFQINELRASADIVDQAARKRAREHAAADGWVMSVDDAVALARAAADAAQAAVDAAKSGDLDAAQRAAQRAQRMAELTVKCVESEVAVHRWLGRDPVHEREFSGVVQQWLVAGLADGEIEFTRLWDLGGPDLIMEAFAEVVRFQNGDDDLGES